MLSFNQLSIGSIVSLRSHPYINKLNNIENKSILFGGEPLLISPLMILTELLISSRYSTDEYTGVALTDKATLQCKCLWYSSKTNKFEEEWFSSKLLKVIDTTNEELNLTTSSSLSLKTIELEAKKLKSSFSSDSIHEEKSSKITALLTYVPPVMQFIGTTKHESKEPQFDSKTNERKRFISRLLVKCKYFNPSSDKFSEVLIPIEALKEIPIISENKLKIVQKHIESKSILSLINQERTTSTTEEEAPAPNVVEEVKIQSQISLIQLKKIIHKFGSYYADYYNFISGESDQIILNEDESQFSKVNEFYFALPKFNVEVDKIVIKKINRENILECLVPFQRALLGAYDQANVYFKIKYLDRGDKYTKRIIGDWGFLTEELPPIENIANDLGVAHVPTAIEPNYIKGYCYLRKAERHFKIDRIEKLEAYYLLPAQI